MVKRVINDLSAILSHFKLQEIADLAIHEFPELTWSEIQKHIVTHNEVLNKKNVIKIIVSIAHSLVNEQLEQRISNLLLLAIGKSKKKIWTAFRLKDNDIDVSIAQIVDNLKNSIRRRGITAAVNMIKFDSKFIISIEKQIKKKSRTEVKNPIFFQFFPRNPYIFCSRKSLEKSIMQSIVEGFGYTRCEICHLSGPNTFDLLKLLRYKEGGVSNAVLLHQQPQVTPSVAINAEGVTEYGQHAKRAQFAEKIFGAQPPQLQAVTVTIKEASWYDDHDVFEMAGSSIKDVKLMLKGPNVVESAKELIAFGVTTTPVPSYLIAILNSAKNDIKITQ